MSSREPRTQFPRALLALATGLSVSTALQAADISGRVKNANTGEPLSGVQVRALESGKEAYTDNSGRYEIQDVDEGSQTLRFEYQGIPTRNEQVEATSEDVVLNVDLGGSGDSAMPQVVVSGQRYAQSKALTKYQNTDAIENFISSDEMGQFVDQNVAESAQRLPGVSITRDQGEGRFVSVRGIGPDLSTVTVNGMRMGTPEDGSRAVPLDVIPTGSVDTIGITKAPTPDMAGDSIGGNVNIESASPFDQDGRKITYRAEASHNQLSGETGPNLQFSISDVFNDKLGVSFGINYRDRELESDNVEAEYDEVEGPNGGTAFTITELQERKYYIERERLGANLNLEFRPDSDTRFFLDTLYSEFTDEETRQRNKFDLTSGDLSSFDGSSGTVKGIDGTDFNRRIRFRTKEQDTLALNAGGEHSFDGWNLDYYAGLSNTKERVLDENEGRFEYNQGQLDANTTIGNGRPNVDISATNGSVLNNANFVLDKTILEPKLVDDDQRNIGFNVEVPGFMDIASLTLKTGVDMRFTEKDVDVNEIELEGPGVGLDEFSKGAPEHGFADLGEGISFSRYLNFFNSNREDFNIADVNETKALRAAEDFVAEEDVASTYLMGTWEMDRWNVISGVRVEQTDFSATGNELDFDTNGNLSVSPTTADSDYTNVLPGIHASYDLTDDMVLRGAWTNTIARPDYQDISPRTEIDRDGGEVEQGNPDLDPFESANYDLMFDWYFAEASVWSLGAFYKDIDNFVVDQTRNNVAVFGGGFDVTQPTNSTEASVQGIETNFQYGFREGALTGVLVGGNLTLLDTELEVPERSGETFSLPTSPDSTGNLFVGYEEGPVSTRLSVSYRDEILNELGDDKRFDIYETEHTQVDFTSSYQVNKSVQVLAEVTNITDEPKELYQGSSGNTYQFEEYGPTFSLGVKGSF